MNESRTAERISCDCSVFFNFHQTVSFVLGGSIVSQKINPN